MEGHWYKSEEPANIEGLTRTDVWKLLELVELAQQLDPLGLPDDKEVYEQGQKLHQKLLDTVYVT